MGEVIDIRTHALFIFNQMTDGLTAYERYQIALEPHVLSNEAVDEEFYEQHKDEIDDMLMYRNVHDHMKAGTHDFKTWAAWMAFEITVAMLREDKELVIE